jgi:hypothetical protein
MGNCQTIAEDGEKRSSSKFGGKPHILIKTFTWARDSHGLFDYESKNLTKKNMKTNNPGKILRQGNDLRLAKDNEKISAQDEKELLKIAIKEGSVVVDTCKEPKEKPKIQVEESLENIDYDLWLVVKSMKLHAHSRGYKLAEGDLIKLGRVKFRIRELNGFANRASKCEKQTKIEDDNVSIGDSDKKDETPIGSRNSVAQQTCRICLSETTEPGDPFFSPCRCTGTMKFIHVKCLQQWLKSKLHIKQSTSSTSVYWKVLECELCKTQYPTYFIVEDKRYDIVEFDRPDCPYIILDILSKEKGITRGIHVIKMENKNSIRLGRGHDSDIRITDISVSRCHAFIKMERGEFYLDDNNSKFGTLVHLKKAFTVPTDIPDVSLQVGRTVVALTIKKGRRFFSACFSNPVDRHNTSNDERNQSDSEDAIDDEVQSPQNNNAQPIEGDNRPNRQATFANRNSPVSRVEDNDGEDEHEEEGEGEGEENEENSGEEEEEEEEENEEEEEDQNQNQENGQNEGELIELPENQMNDDDDGVNGVPAQSQIENQIERVEHNPNTNNNQESDNLNDCDGPVD